MIVFRKLTQQTLNLYQELAKKTYQDAFSYTTSSQNMTNYLKETFSDEAVKKELNNSETEIYLVQYNDDIAGYLKLNFGASQSSDKRPSDWVELERLYLLNSM